MHKRTVGVLMGGSSSEREVSIRSGEAIIAALRARQIHAVPVYLDRDVDQILRQEHIDVAFLALHGRIGEDGCIQGLLESMGIPYTGSDVLASALAMDKVKAKELFRLHNLPTPAYYVLSDEDELDVLSAHGDFGFPCVVKPAREGSSVGVAVCRDPAALAHAVEVAFRFDDRVLVERHIDGQEVSVAVFGDRAIGAVEIAPTLEFYNFAAKYTQGATEYFIPPRLSPERYRGLLAQAARAHRALGCRGATRVDLIVSESGNEFLLEINTIPGMTPTSLLPKIALSVGIDFGQLCEMMLAGASLSTWRHHQVGRAASRALADSDTHADLVGHH